MTRRAWCSPEQRAWLEEHISAFLKAKKAKATSEFFASITTEFLSKWPVTPTDKELMEAKNDQKHANNLAEDTRGDQIRNWFNNHTRPWTSGSGSRQVLNLSAPPKLVQPWQAFQNLLWKSELKTKVSAEWESYKATFPEKMKPTEKYFSYKNALIQKWYNEASEDLKVKVEEHRQLMKIKGTAVEKEPKDFQCAIGKLPRTLEMVAESVARQTGWNITIIAGGPMPRLGGQLETLAVHHGTTTDGKDYGQYLDKGYVKSFIDPFVDFLLLSFDEESRSARALTHTPEEDGNDSEDPEDEPQDSRCEYEKERDANIARNQACLEVLGLASSPEKPKPKRTRKKRDNTNPEASRRSGRGKNIPTQSIPPSAASTTPVAREDREPSHQGLSETTTPSQPNAKHVDTALSADKQHPPESEENPAKEVDSDAEERGRSAKANTDPSAGADSSRVEVEETEYLQSIADRDGTQACAKGDNGSSSQATDMPGLWQKLWLKYFRGISEDSRWVKLITCWTVFEALGPESGKLPTKLRPEAVGWWIKRHRTITNIPTIEDTVGFAATWRAWWVSMQPLWRDGEAFLKETPAEADWGVLSGGGPLGLGLVVMTLAWWIEAIGDDESMFAQTKLAEAIADVEWVLDQLSAILSSDSDCRSVSVTSHVSVLSSGKPKSKRALSPSPGAVDKPRSKRYDYCCS